LVATSTLLEEADLSRSKLFQTIDFTWVCSH
jgi:hypothetical protein